MDSNDSSRRRPHTHRRSKKQIPNNFKCGDRNCDKAYGSNAALYTHIKTKHGGVEPPGTVRPQQTSAKGQKGRPKAADSPPTETQDQYCESTTCRICQEKEKCICPQDFDERLISLLSQESFINFIKCIGNFGEHKKSAESTNEWIRSVDDDIHTLNTDQVKKMYRDFCSKYTSAEDLNNRLAGYLTCSSTYLSESSVAELFNGIFAITWYQDDKELARFISKEPSLKKFNKQMEANSQEFKALVRAVQQVISLKDGQ